MSTSKRLLDPIDRVSEVLFGLIMALTFTCSISAASRYEVADVADTARGSAFANSAMQMIRGSFASTASSSMRG